MNEVRAKSAKLKKAGQAVGGAPTYEFECGKCDHKFSALIPLNPAYQKAACPNCGVTNTMR